MRDIDSAFAILFTFEHMFDIIQYATHTFGFKDKDKPEQSA
jgi:hypothetical protein